MSYEEPTLDEKIKNAKGSVQWAQDELRDTRLEEQLDRARLRVLELQATARRFAISDTVREIEESEGELRKLERELATLLKERGDT